MTKSEKITLEISKKSFLSFWCYNNPIRKDTKKEFTDILIVNLPFILIISVKEINVKNSGDPIVDAQRWFRRGIEKSYKQIYGAERIIKDGITKILTHDGKEEINIPDNEKLEIFRIGVSIGRRESFALPFGEFETGFIHFFDQVSFPKILQELDTISDFIEYLKAKEEYFNQGKTASFKSEEDLLAVYLKENRSFPANFDSVILDNDLWKEFIEKPAYKSRKKQEEESYVWDRIIEEFFNDYTKKELLCNDLKEIEISLRTMSKECRFDRMALSKCLLEVTGFYSKSTIKARLLQSSSKVIYVFLIAPHDEHDREYRLKQLNLYCLAARNTIDFARVVGIATNRYIKGGGHSYDLCYINKPELTNDERNKINVMQKKLGIFNNSKKHHQRFDEYPK